MKARIVTYLAMIFSNLLAISCNDATIVKVDGVTCMVEFPSPHIARIIRYTDDLPVPRESYSVIKVHERVPVTKTELGDTLRLETSAIRVDIMKSSGIVVFYDAQGHELLAESGCRFNIHGEPMPSSKSRTSQEWILEEDEHIYGLGQLQRKDAELAADTVSLWNHNSYISLPYFVSEKGYAIFWDNPGHNVFHRTNGMLGMTAKSRSCIDYYFMFEDGTVDGTVRCMRDLTGDVPMLPLWAFGYWQSRDRYRTTDEVVATLDRFRKDSIPLDVIVQDWHYWGADSSWNSMKFHPDYIGAASVEEMTGHIHSRNAHSLISVWPSFGLATTIHEEMSAGGHLLPFDTWPLNGTRAYDAFDPDARELYWSYVKPLLDAGFDDLWTDATEPEQFNEAASDYDHQTHDGAWCEVKNAYPLATNKGIYERRLECDRSRRAFQMTRSSYIGAQHYGTFSWSGDIEATWDAFKAQIPSGLGFSITGMPYWNTDIGGFSYGMYEDPSPKNPYLQEMQVRWMQWSVFVPIMRNHCSSPMINEIWTFGNPGDWAYDAQLQAIKLRYRLLPYIYSIAGDITHGSGTMMRPFVMDFPEDATALDVDDEYMFGPAFLVKPITDPFYTECDGDGKCGYADGFDERAVASGTQTAKVATYLPSGIIWYDVAHGGIPYEGGQTVELEYDIFSMPVFIKAGSIVPIGPDVQYATEKRWDALELHVYPGVDGSFTLYEDSGDGYGYEDGEFSVTDFHWDDAGKTLSISDRKGSFDGMLDTRTFLVKVGEEARSIRYDGAMQIIKFKP